MLILEFLQIKKNLSIRKVFHPCYIITFSLSIYIEPQCDGFHASVFILLWFAANCMNLLYSVTYVQYKLILDEYHAQFMDTKTFSTSTMCETKNTVGGIYLFEVGHLIQIFRFEQIHLGNSKRCPQDVNHDPDVLHAHKLKVEKIVSLGFV